MTDIASRIAAAPGYSCGYSNIAGYCWIRLCQTKVDPDDAIGLCPYHYAQLREEP